MDNDTDTIKKRFVDAGRKEVHSEPATVSDGRNAAETLVENVVIPGNLLRGILALSTSFIRTTDREKSFDSSAFSPLEKKRLAQQGFVFGKRLNAFGYTSEEVVCAFCRYTCHETEVPKIVSGHIATGNCSFIHTELSIRYGSEHKLVKLEKNCIFARENVERVRRFFIDQWEIISTVIFAGYNSNTMLTVFLKYELCEECPPTQDAEKILAIVQCDRELQLSMCITFSDLPDIWSLLDFDKAKIPSLSDNNYEPNPILCQDVFSSNWHARLAFIQKYNESHNSELVYLENLCKVCHLARANCVVIPCGHLSVCSRCLAATKQVIRMCPKCRMVMHRTVQAYFS